MIRRRSAHACSRSASTAQRVVTIGQRCLAQRGWPRRPPAAPGVTLRAIGGHSAFVEGRGRRGRPPRARLAETGRRLEPVDHRTSSAAAPIRSTRVRRPPAVDSTHRPTHLADLVEAAAARHADHAALIDAATGHTLTWAELDATVSAEARRLTAAGVVAGDRVVIRCAGAPALAVAVLGAVRAGAVAVPVGPGDLVAVVAACTPRVRGGRRTGARNGRHRPRSPRPGRARGAGGRRGRARGPRAPAAHLRRPRSCASRTARCWPTGPRRRRCARPRSRPSTAFC